MGDSAYQDYIPVGCLLIQRDESNVPSGLWPISDLKRWQPVPGDLGPDPEPLQQQPGFAPAIGQFLLTSDTVSPYVQLLRKRWVQFSFSVSLDDPEEGILRIYLLPDDVGRRSIDREDPVLRRARRSLLSQLDFSKSTWHGEAGIGPSSKPVPFHGGPEINDDQSLLQMFNNIPSPDPQPRLIRDATARAFAYNLIDSDVPGLKTTLYPYQRRSAALMLQKEVQPEQVLDPRLVKVVDQSGNPWYYDAIDGIGLVEPRYYDGVCGGILAEEMGSGKTLICLALILATKHQTSQAPDIHRGNSVMNRPKTGSLADMAAACITRNAVPWKLWFGTDDEDGTEYAKCVEAIQRNPGHYFLPQPWRRRKNIRQPSAPRTSIKVSLSYATLVVVPPNLVQQWKQEISKHTIGLKVLVCVRKQELPPVHELLEYDILLFSSTRFERLWLDVTTDRDGAYLPESPLAQIHFKRCIVDEGHKLGNSTASNKSNLHLMLDSLQISARWIVTGTPSKGLFGVDQSPASSVPSTPDEAGRSQRLGKSSNEQERDDLRRIGSIAALYLKARPWANTMTEVGDTLADWSVYVMQPKHSPRSSGRKDCLKATLKSLIIRHRVSEVAQLLPVVNERVVYLDGSYQDKLSLNLFSMVIISNAVQSQRTDQDYLFHARQRKALMELVSNLRAASFFGGSFFSPDAIRTIVGTAERFLDDGKVQIPAEDHAMLREAISFGHIAAKNSLKTHAHMLHEVPIYVENFPFGLGHAWSLDRTMDGPVHMDSRMVLALQGYLQPTVGAPTSLQLLFTTGKLKEQGFAELNRALDLQLLLDGTSGVPQHNGNPTATLAGNTQVGEDKSRLGKHRSTALGTLERMDEIPLAEGECESEIAAPLAETRIISTVSAKLSYLVDQVVKHQQEEQIIIFYENDNVAYYISGMLEILQIHHLIYSKSLSIERRAQYVATFNHNPKFRVMLMEISQAAFGLDMRSASRIYFINPVLNPQVEAQAIGRARRISQKKPVTVETLVLRGSMDEVIVQRRQEMTQAEQRKCRSILDDRPIYNWILNARIIPLPAEEPGGPAQTAMLKTPQFVFGRGFGRGLAHPDEDLVAVPVSPTDGNKTSSSGIRIRVAVRTAAAASATPTERAQSQEVVLDTIMAKEKGAIVTILTPTPGKKRRLPCESGPGPGSTSKSEVSFSRPSRRVRFAADDDDDDDDDDEDDD